MRPIHRLFRAFGVWLQRQNVYSALALQRRGEVRADGLEVIRLTSRLEVEWWARELHPWDRFASPEKAAFKFVQQTLADTEAAIAGLFDASGLLDVIHLRVLERRTGSLIIDGVVERSTVERNPSLSVGMRLVQSGVRFHSFGWGFEPLDSCARSEMVFCRNPGRYKDMA
jgi:hypothetical protein